MEKLCWSRENIEDSKELEALIDANSLTFNGLTDLTVEEILWEIDLPTTVDEIEKKLDL